MKLRKCVFLQPEVTYLGFRINKDGVLPLPEKVEIIKNTQVPKNVAELKSFLGFINYYHRHLQNFSSFLESFNFNKAKELLSLANLLVHYDTKKPLFRENVSSTNRCLFQVDGHKNSNFD